MCFSSFIRGNIYEKTVFIISHTYEIHMYKMRTKCEQRKRREMMNLAIICVGKIKEDYLQKGIEACIKTLRKSHKFEIIELPDEKTPDGASEKEEKRIKELEGKKILEKIKDDDHVIALCIEGKLVNDIEWQKQVKRGQDRRCVFVIGGSLGLADVVVKRANEKMSFSRMTFPHQLMRYMLLEEISTLL